MKLLLIKHNRIIATFQQQDITKDQIIELLEMGYMIAASLPTNTIDKPNAGKSKSIIERAIQLSNNLPYQAL